ncbi:PfkB family carbohydrate kinase [Spelaeicoccus albus]|uniref:Fructoselysine 6-kinase n=1 Tax=Spelaeicoccus albus TaxID=1280376 RepID=A0A7Z0D254_9MICO|nr:PfkB family carbohydrate kinase [Spelaeicoccus albus]NYI67483.1 fructoselysine 6-kinase [Spelaeicoccus albus]
MRLLGIGDNVLDHYMNIGMLYPGGNAVNVSVYAAQLGADAAGYVGIVGSDAMGDHLMSALDAEGLDLAQVRRAIGPTGSPKVSIDATGNRVFVGSNKGGVQHGLRLRLTDEDVSLASAANVVHTSVYSALEDALPDLAAVAPVSFDFSDERDPAYVGKVAPHVQHAFFSGSGLDGAEVQALATSALNAGCATAVVTLGSDGAWVTADSGEAFAVPTEAVEIVDTLGAGDGFIAGFLVAHYTGATLCEAAAAGTAGAARACRFNGAFGRAISESELVPAAAGTAADRNDQMQPR